MDSESSQNSNLAGAAWLISAGIAFACMTLLIRPATEQVHPMQLVFLRNLVGMLLLMPLLMHQGSIAVWRSPNLGWHVGRAVLVLSAMLCWFTAIPLVKISDAIALNFTVPIWVTIWAGLFLGEKVRGRRWSAIAIGFLGALLVIRPGFKAFGVGETLVMLDAVLWSLAVVMVRRLARTESPANIVTYMFILVLPISLIPALFHWSWPSLEGWLLITGVAVSSTVGHYCSTRAIAMAELSAIMPFDYLRLIWFTFGAFVFYGEMPESLTLVGAGIIAASSLYILRREAILARRRRDSALVNQPAD